MTDFRVHADDLHGLSDQELAWKAIEPVYDELRTPYEPDPRYAELTPGQRALYVLHWVRSEVGNGGFDQLFYNSTGMLAADAPTAADLVGASHQADLLRQANSVFPDGRPPGDHEERRRLLAALSDDEMGDLDDLADRLYDLDATPGTALASYLAAYVRDNPDEFARGSTA